MNSAIVLLMADLFKGTKIAGYYSNFNKFTETDPDHIREIQKTKLKNLLDHAYMRIPWYRGVLKRAGITPDDIREINDLVNIPVLTRDDIRNHMDEMLWKEYRGKIFAGSSSGTTGMPIKYFQDVNGTSAGVAAGHLLWGLSGWKPGMRNIHVWGNIESIKQWRKPISRINQWLNSRKNIASTLVNDHEQIANVIDRIAQFKPLAMDGYTNSIYELALVLEKSGIRFPSLKMVFTTAENLEIQQQKLIGDFIAPVSDLYGCGEINGIACKPIHDDKYYIFDPHVIAETPAHANSEMKEILVTDLDNFYMPFIRYQIGDLIDEVKPASAVNRYPFSYFTRIFGRTSDHIVLPDGKKLFPVSVFGGTLYRKHDAITRHKAVWDGKKLTFYFETKGSLALDALKKDIQLSLQRYNVQFAIEITDKLLPDKNGKFKYFEKVH